MRVLVTGASGFVGRQTLAPLASLGAEVHAVSRAAHVDTSDCRWLCTDLLKPGAAESVIAAARPDVVLNLAWCVEHGRFWTDPANRAWADAAVDLGRAALAAGVRRFIGVGTCYEYAWPDDGDCIERRAAIETHTPYDAAKDQCRRALEDVFAAQPRAFAWARLFFLYGPGEAEGRLVSSIAAALGRGTVAACSSGAAVRDFLDVRDAGAALAALALSDVTGPVNIASGQARSVADIACELGKLAGREDLIGLGALPDRPHEPSRIVADVGRLRDEVGFEPARTLTQGLADALAYWQART